jgi:hypothetical protein
LQSEPTIAAADFRNGMGQVNGKSCEDRSFDVAVVIKPAVESAEIPSRRNGAWIIRRQIIEKFRSNDAVGDGVFQRIYSTSKIAP